MELVIFAVACAILAILALRYGYDSRIGPESKEETWAQLGTRHDLQA